ncbi:MAG: hypothetical protein LC130_27350 [Bryobacterales bacterium]|nr:hypothetical protein [Bryobacterales bacterium]
MNAMVPPTLATPDEMRRVLRKRLRERSAAWVEILGSEIPPGSHTKNEMLTLLRAKLRARGDRGVANLVKNLVLEPRNPLEPSKRRLPKREVVAVSSLLAMLCGALVWFNFLVR